MKSKFVYTIVILFWIGAFFISGNTLADFVGQGYNRPAGRGLFLYPPDTTIKKDSTRKSSLVYPFEDEGVPYSGQENNNGMFLKNPSNITSDVEYDPIHHRYILKHKLGDSLEYRSPTYMNLDEYRDYDLRNSLHGYWRERAKAAGMGTKSGIIPSIYIGGQVFDRIFGGSTIDIRPSGSAELIFGVLANRRDDPALDIRQRRTVNFDFQEKIQMSVIAKIGDKIEFKTNYNTEATFEFENKLKLRYEGKEDEIIKLIEAGDVNLPLNSTLITGSQSLFGIKTKLQFGKTTVTAIFSEQESETQTITVQGGAQTSQFQIKADEYEENKHFFLSHFARNHYEEALSSLPLISSGINITKIEVWVTNIGAAVTENRNIVAFTDLGENNASDIFNKYVLPNPGRYLPDNLSNNLLSFFDTTELRDINKVSTHLLQRGFVAGEDFEKIESARKLTASEFTYNSKLGFISLNMMLNSDQTLAVAFQYQVIGDSTVYQVGEFSDQGIIGKSCLIVKLLKSTYINIRNPLWDLMMKNVYSLNAYQVNREDFTLNILYSGDKQGVPTGYFNEGPENIKGKPLIQVFNLDKLDAQQNPGADGVFDFMDNASTQGGNINSSTGRIFFPMLEPFGSYLRKKFINAGAPELANKYCYDSLYTLTKTGAQQYAEKNKFLIEGYYKSASGSEISLNALNVPQGSVKVTAGGIPLTENVDYTVDYTLGRVRIINEGILNSGAPIRITNENNTLFSIQTKRLMGAHIDHEVNKNFHLGSTILNLTERPLTQKVNYGDDPISNTIWGLDYRYQTEARLITKLIDKLPLISTAAPSIIALDGEFAHFLPGHSRAVGKTGTAYIDDFEGSKSTIDMRNYGSWFLASTPQRQDELFPEAMTNSGIEYGFNRAKISWYTIDPTVFYDRNSTLKPGNVSSDELSNNYARQVLETEVFPNKDIPNGTPTNIAILNVAYYPADRGPYNYDVSPTGVSAGLNEDGTLKEPGTRWAGIMREIESPDFEATNVEYIEFWLMDPFAEGSLNDGTGGQLYFNLGDVSEDILRDSRKSFEHGLPTTDDVKNVDTTIWGRIPSLLDLVESFDNTPGSRQYQDVGYDGLRDLDEASFFSDASIFSDRYPYMDYLANAFGQNSGAYQKASTDPSADNYHNFRGDDYDQDPLYGSVLERYKSFNGAEGNSPENTSGGIFDGNTRYPNVEDLNDDNTLSEAERYYQYRIDLVPEKMEVGMNYISDVYNAQGIPLTNGEIGNVKWYQFKIPVRSPDKIVGNIQDYKSIRFLRMFLRGFSTPVVLRFATLDLVRGEWRRYPVSEDLLAPGEYIPTSNTNQTTFDISAVNIEENGKRYPVPYVVPPGIEREINMGTTNLTRYNEQAMVMKVCGLVDGDVRAAYKTTDFDFRQYKKLKMFVHAEKSLENDQLKYGDLTVFIRLGSDFTENYYEYEVPLTFTPWGTSYEDEYGIWPDANLVNIDLEELVAVKHQRNMAIRESGSSVTSGFPFRVYSGNNRITVLGSPNISDVKAILIGVRNPRKTTLTSDDDGEPKCAEIWVNELRVTDFSKKGGWAATTRVNITLADLGNLQVSGMYSSPGFGSLDQKINETQRESSSQFDIATNIELGKLLHEKSGVKIPMHFDYSEQRLVPEYNPLDPDIKLKEDIKSYNTSEKRDSIRRLTQDFTQRKNINFMNVRKDRMGGGETKPRFYDIENFNASYSYSEIYHRNIDIEYDLQKTYTGGLGYNYNVSPKNIKPFEKVGLISKYKAFQLIKDFNFYYLPKMISFRTDMNRMNNERKLRKKSIGDIITQPYFNRTWDWNRIYDVKFDLAQSLSVDYSATSNSYIDEPSGSLNRDDPDYRLKRDTIVDQLLSFGRKKKYTQNLNITYNIPINKLPLLDWLSAQAGYQATYDWTASAISIQNELGNVAENSRARQISANADLSRIYNRVPYLKKLTETKPKTPPKKKPDPKQDGDQKADDGQDTLKTKKRDINYVKEISRGLVRLIIGLKKASFQYMVNDGTLIPGFVPEPVSFGNDWGLNAPGLGFILGNQPDGPEYFRDWLTRSSRLNQSFITKYNQSLSVKATYEPFKDFKIDFTAERSYSKNFSEFFVVDSILNEFKHSNSQETGTFSISYLTWGTAFGGSLSDEKSHYFENLKEYRVRIANRLARGNPYWSNKINDTTGFPQGYGPTSQYVLLPAFLAAYSGKGPDKITLQQFPKIPMPNWRVSFAGLSKIAFLKAYFKSITINHSYRSSYSIGGFTTNMNFRGVDGNPTEFNIINGDYIPQYEFQQVSIMEQFSPLINFDMTLQNSLLLKLEMKRSRNLSLSFVNNQLTEVLNKEYVIGLGYRFKEVPFTFASFGGGPRKTYKSDLNLKADFSIRNNKTVLRRIDIEQNQISAGQKTISINTSADYTINQKINLRLFFDKIITNPFLPSQYRNSTTNGGISIRFMLAQ